MLTLDEWEVRAKADFPYRAGRVYLNSAGAGLPWPGAPAAAAEYYTHLAAWGASAQPEWVRRAELARVRVGRLLRVPSEDVTFLRNTSDVMNLAANSVAWRPGDEVVVAADDFPSVVLPWTTAEAAGGTLHRVEIDDERLREDRLLERIGARTRVLAVTHVHAVTGSRLDLERLGRACREVGALLVVDGIEALGAIDVDLTWVDVYGAAVFKWMLSGFGLSIGVFADRARDQLTPAYRGYRNAPPSRSFEYSDPNYPGLYVLDSTLQYLDSLGWESVHGKVADLTAMVDATVSAQGFTPVTDAAARAGIISFGVDDAEGLVTQLQDRGIDVVHKRGLVRVSPHFYTSREDVRLFGEALADAVAAAGIRPVDARRHDAADR
ncbi:MULTISPECIES: aminotransferase class V-fold PLP-dependent enzyme [unclassified Microbacterium]|uniref:aminotransferase class V-fold PLP-dependent enzyme n=1 Tax=unclassified Microbacterium TaxID=2609290 RepID=UPI00214C07F8|nr:MULTISPECIES: aminotransferase class V-fold PLP-dependent enzyme [unclassified Microbacterium]MCR2808667.1 aminotransferase class V-fold PLP-dependent enzyme [Microbacterium sp. zg.B185]WIM18901.1 aminotransferase class V-fold PLP-dependent enzyme [Microbacterium sp. zg-B185]